jgi:hypothetical protein
VTQLEQALHHGVAAVCAYEAVAILTGRAPTITTLCGGHRWLAFAVVGGLSVHLWRAQPPEQVIVVMTAPSPA